MSATLAAPRRPNRLWAVMKRDPLALVAFLFLLLLVIVAIFPEQVSNFFPNRPTRQRLLPPWVPLRQWPWSARRPP